MILGTKARYAVMAMVELASRDGASPVSLSELAASQEIPLAYLEQIFARLRQQGIVHSVRGPGGGYVIASSPDAIRISDIVNAADESLKMTRCDMDNPGCMPSRTRCKTHHLWEGLEQQIYDYLRSVTLADVQEGKCFPTASALRMEALPQPL